VTATFTSNRVAPHAHRALCTTDGLQKHADGQRILYGRTKGNTALIVVKSPMPSFALPRDALTKLPPLNNLWYAYAARRACVKLGNERAMRITSQSNSSALTFQYRGE